MWLLLRTDSLSWAPSSPWRLQTGCGPPTVVVTYCLAHDMGWFFQKLLSRVKWKALAVATPSSLIVPPSTQSFIHLGASFLWLCSIYSDELWSRIFYNIPHLLLLLLLLTGRPFPFVELWLFLISPGTVWLQEIYKLCTFTLPRK